MWKNLLRLLRVTQILNAGFQFDRDYIDSSQEKIETEYHLDEHDWMLWDFISIEITYVTVLKKNIYAHNTKWTTTSGQK